MAGPLVSQLALLSKQIFTEVDVGDCLLTTLPLPGVDGQDDIGEGDGIEPLVT